MLTFCTQWRFIPSKRRYQLYSTIKLVRYYPNSPSAVFAEAPKSPMPNGLKWCPTQTGALVA